MLPKRSIFRARSVEFLTLLGVALAAACYASAVGQEPGRAAGKGARPAGTQPHGNPGQAHPAGTRPQSHHPLHGTPPDFNFHHPLQREIDRLKADAKPKPPAKDYDKESLPGKKAMLLDNAIQHYRSMFKEETKMVAHELASPLEYEISMHHTPAYFSGGIDEAHRTVVRQAPEHMPYSYNTSYDKERVQFWLDFADMKLGGGVFGNGFLEEETMFLEMPELANAAALHSLFTRTGSDPGILQGNPTPWAFMDVRRVMHIKPEATKDGWRTMHAAALDAADERLAHALTVNVLSIAVPKLSKGTPQASPPVVRDLFNSFVAGFELARQASGAKSDEPILIHTGPIGTGDFENDPKVIYVLQNLAAQKVGRVALRLWMYNPKLVESADADYLGPILNEYKNLPAKEKSIDKLLEMASLKMSGLHATHHR